MVFPNKGNVHCLVNFNQAFIKRGEKEGGGKKVILFGKKDFTYEQIRKRNNQKNSTYYLQLHSLQLICIFTSKSHVTIFYYDFIFIYFLQRGNFCNCKKR